VKSEGAGLLASARVTFWLPLAILATAAWWLVPDKIDALPGFDWQIYAAGFRQWMATGTPYTVPALGWDPCREYPYLYPPTSWPLLPLAAIVPYWFTAIGALPLLLRPPAFVLVPISAVLLFLGLGPAIYLANVNVLVAGLLVLAFMPGRIGGSALAAAVAIKGYPIVLLPFLWSDRRRLTWFAGSLALLAVSGTILFGVGGWVDFATTLLRQGAHCDVSLNPFAGLGLARLGPAAALVLVGLGVRSPTLTLLGATFATGVVTRHYLVTLAAMLAIEPMFRGRGDHEEAGPKSQL
jgi:hypothetical protein